MYATILCRRIPQNGRHGQAFAACHKVIMHTILPSEHMPKNIFPQFTRFFPAMSFSSAATIVLRTGIWLVLAVFIGTNIGLLMRPLSERSANVLGAETPDAQTPDFATIKNRFDAWKNIVDTHPDYRDGYYMLSLLSYQLRHFEESRAYLAAVKKLDPNFNGISQMEALLSKE